MARSLAASGSTMEGGAPNVGGLSGSVDEEGGLLRRGRRRTKPLCNVVRLHVEMVHERRPTAQDTEGIEHGRPGPNGGHMARGSCCEISPQIAHHTHGFTTTTTTTTKARPTARASDVVAFYFQTTPPQAYTRRRRLAYTTIIHRRFLASVRVASFHPISQPTIANFNLR